MKISKREEDVLNLLVEGLMYKNIAASLNISIDTVKKHCKSLYVKAAVKSRSELASLLL